MHPETIQAVNAKLLKELGKLEEEALAVSVSTEVKLIAENARSHIEMGKPTKAISMLVSAARLIAVKAGV